MLKTERKKETNNFINIYILTYLWMILNPKLKKVFPYVKKISRI